MYLYARSIDSAMRIAHILRVILMDSTANNAARYRKKELEKGKR
jgi:hypothetical protein